MPLARFLKNKRTCAALTQLEVGQRLGFHKSQFVSSMERGTSRPPIQVLKKMCEIYQIPETEMRKAYIHNAVVKAEARACDDWDNEDH
ncbi:helix-turn-helix domain-containing protein [Bdellovibrio bacteriovorus]|uniref:helix-turn-helix domain-containing protein n=1 Tax=Bdellovibrio bacteriovorus TaxID=959 RepID=UPI0035A59483